MATDPSYPDPADAPTEDVESRYERDWATLRDLEAGVSDEDFDPTRFERTRTHIDDDRAEREYVDENGTTVIPSEDYGQPLE
jgi:hypothetical protein